MTLAASTKGTPDAPDPKITGEKSGGNSSSNDDGSIGYLKSLIPGGVSGPILFLIFPLEVISTLMRILSLTIRLFANILAGHMIILFMAGGLAVVLGLSFLGWFTMPFGIALYLFELGLVATLQAFIFATLAAIYIGGAVSHH